MSGWLRNRTHVCCVFSVSIWQYSIRECSLGLQFLLFAWADALISESKAKTESLVGFVSLGVFCGRSRFGLIFSLCFTIHQLSQVSALWVDYDQYLIEEYDRSLGAMLAASSTRRDIQHPMFAMMNEVRKSRSC